MRSTIALAAAACLGLAACGGGDGNSSGSSSGNAAASGADAGSASASGAGAAGTGAKLTPGLYETTAEMKIGGLPEGMAKAMEPSQEKKRQCITPEEASKGSADLFSTKDENCQQKDVVFAGGRIHGTLTCRGKEGGEGASTVTIDGTYSSTGYDVRSQMSVQAGGKPMTIDAHLVGRRVGECTGSEEE